MLQSLKRFFSKQESSNNIEQSDSLNILCGIMLEAANTDGVVSQEEVDKISSILIDIFKEKPVEVENTIAQSLKNVNEPKSLHFYTSKINKKFSEQEKLLLIETLWEIILADGKIHDFESNLIRRLAGLLYVSDVNCGNAKRKAINKIKEGRVNDIHS